MCNSGVDGSDWRDECASADVNWKARGRAHPCGREPTHVANLRLQAVPQLECARHVEQVCGGWRTQITLILWFSHFMYSSSLTPVVCTLGNSRFYLLLCIQFAADRCPDWREHLRATTRAFHGRRSTRTDKVSATIANFVRRLICPSALFLVALTIHCLLLLLVL